MELLLRKEKEFEKLQQRMRALLNEKKKEIRTNAEVAGFWQQQASAMSPSRPPKKGDQETFKVGLALLQHIYYSPSHHRYCNRHSYVTRTSMTL